MEAGNPEGIDMVVGDTSGLALGTCNARGLYVDLTDFLQEKILDTSVLPLALK